MSGEGWEPYVGMVRAGKPVFWNPATGKWDAPRPAHARTPSIVITPAKAAAACDAILDRLDGADLSGKDNVI